ncbi:MAG: hypothetical protein R2795_12550 [Saprospiraceae bacterium]
MNDAINADNYRLQVATDAAFTNIVVDVANITVSNYTLSSTLVGIQLIIGEYDPAAISGLVYQ